MEKRIIQVGCSDIDENGIKYVNAVLKSGSLVNGVYTQRFESEFAELHGNKHGVFLNSGTDALRIAIATLKEVYQWKDGDEVLCPATTFVASANVIVQNGLRVKFVDVEPTTYNIYPSQIACHCGSRTRAVVVVHLFGLPADMSAIVASVKKHRLKLIEDSCETMFVKQKGRVVGSFGDIACFSTYMAHIITTGVGGLAITNNARYAQLIRSYQNHGRDPVYLGGNYGSTRIGDPEILRRRFRFDRIGYSARATEMDAALGLAQLERWPEIIAQRQRVADRLIREGYRAGLNKFLQFPIHHPDYTDNARMMFPLVVLRGNMWEFAAYLEKNGIETRPLMPLITQPVYRLMYDSLQEAYPISASLAKKGLYIGCHQKMNDEDVDYVIEHMRRYFKC